MGWRGDSTIQQQAGNALGQMGPLGFAPFLFGINACVEDGLFFPVKPLSYFCPVACGCRSGDPHCPDGCPARNESTPDCPDEWRLSGPQGVAHMDWFNPSPYRTSIGELDPTCPLAPKNRF